MNQNFPEIPSADSFRHSMEVQLRFNDIDILGHLNNTVYLSLYDLGKARWMEAVKGGDINFQKVESVIANINCSFVKQIKFGERIFVSTRCSHIGRKSFTLDQVLTDHTGEVRSICRTVMVCYDPASRQTVDVSKEWREAIKNYEKTSPEE
ncbi:MAG: acyl-CoA thioesterase [Muribaculum sp.]|nr:acyl-CoA thioesterase [Muribaculum sp.]